MKKRMRGTTLTITVSIRMTMVNKMRRMGAKMTMKRTKEWKKKMMRRSRACRSPIRKFDGPLLRCLRREPNKPLAGSAAVCSEALFQCKVP